MHDFLEDVFIITIEIALHNHGSHTITISELSMLSDHSGSAITLVAHNMQ